MGMSVGELFVSLGFDVDDGKLKSFNDSIKSASGEILKLSAIATAGVYALDAFLEGSINRAFGLKNFKTETGQAEEGLLRFQSAVNQTNAAISTSEAAAKYRALADAMTDISQQGGGAALARLTGGAFHIGMKEEEVIEAIRNYKQQFIAENGGGQIGIAAHARLLDQIGVGAGSERAFDLSSGQYKSMTDEYVAAEMKAEDANVRLGGAIAKVKQAWTEFRDTLVADWADPLIAGLKSSKEWLEDFGKSVDAIINEWKKWPEWIKDVSLVLLAALAIWAAPFGATLAVVTAIGAAIWDIGRAIRGLPSVTGTIFDAEKKGIKLLFNDPKKFGSNIMDTLDQIVRPAAQWAGNVNKEASASSITQNNSNHIYTKADAKEVVHEVMNQNQRDLNKSLMALVGRPAY